MSTRAFVVNPWVTDFKLYDEWMHPLGLYFLISLLEYNGFEVSFFNCLTRDSSTKKKRFSTGDFGRREFPKPALYHAVKRQYKLYGQSQNAFEYFLSSSKRPDVIFLGSHMTYWLPGLVETVRVIRLHYPEIPVVAGGTAVRLAPQVVRSALPDVYCFDGSLFDEPSIRRSRIPLFSQLQSAAWTPSFLEAFKHYPSLHHGPVLTSMGCPLSCSYCASGVLFQGLHRRRYDDVLSEIDYCRTHHHVEDFALFDDALLFDASGHCMPLLMEIARRGMIARFHTPNGLHAQWFTPKLAELMARCGFRTIRFGYESGQLRHRRDIGSKTSKTQLGRAVSLALRSGFDCRDVGVYVMAGLPGQIPADVEREIDFIASLSVKPRPVFISPVPHTRLFHYYAGAYPLITTDPLLQNDSFFITQLPGWDAIAVQQIVDRAKRHNCRLDAHSRCASL